MNKKTKKIIAREFLFFLGTSLLFLILVFGSQFLKNRNSLNERIAKNKLYQLKEVKNLPYRLRILYTMGDISPKKSNLIKNKTKFISDLKNNQKFASNIYLYLKENVDGISTTDKEFIIKIEDDHDSESHLNEIMSLEERLIDIRSSIFSDSFDDKNSLINLALTLFGFLFGFRYLIYGTQWSIKQLREKN